MKLLAAIVYAIAGALLLSGPALGQSTPPIDTVRVVAVGDNKMCSAVVIAPDLALTARHCLQRGMSVGAVAVDYVIAAGPVNQDIAVLHAPGLACPCAAIGERPAVGATVLAIGFPGRLNGVMRVTSEAAVQAVDTLAVLAPWIVIEEYATQVYILTDKPLLDGGDSGGGLFAVQNGEWKLIGINSIGVPSTPNPFSQQEQASGFVPVDVASKFIPKT